MRHEENVSGFGLEVGDTLTDSQPVDGTHMESCLVRYHFKSVIQYGKQYFTSLVGKKRKSPSSYQAL